MRGPLSGAVDPDAARRAAEEILADERFHPRRGPRPFAGFFRRLGELLVDPILRFVRSIGDLFPDVGTLPWLVLAVAVVVAAALLTVRLSSGSGRRRGAAGGAAGGDEEEGQGPEELERRAGDAEIRGDLDLALRLRFRAGLLRLADAGTVRLRPGLTNAAVSRALLSPRFDRLAGDFDEVAYGGRPATPDDIAAARSAWPAVVEAAAGSRAERPEARPAAGARA